MLGCLVSKETRTTRSSIAVRAQTVSLKIIERRKKSQEEVMLAASLSLVRCRFRFGVAILQSKRRRRRSKRSMDSSRDDLLGEGGPLVLTTRGKWLVAGFAYGGIVRAPLLPDQFDHSTSTERGSSDGLVSCSSLPSDEWFCPILESEGDSDEEEDSDDNEDSEEDSDGDSDDNEDSPEGDY